MENEIDDTPDFYAIMDEYSKQQEIEYLENQRVNNRLLTVLKSYMGTKWYKQFMEEIEESGMVGKFEIVNYTRGERQSLSAFRKNMWVDQSTGYECDDYYGWVYIELKDNKYLRFYYNC